jgi:hypothetical protein
MMAGSGPGHFFGIVFSFSCIFLIIGAYAELKNRDRRPFKVWRFYVMAAATVLPFIGPFLVFWLLYSFQNKGQKISLGFFGFFPVLFKLKANVLIIFLLFVILFVLFFLINRKDDPYYNKQRYRHNPNGNLPQSVLTTDNL